MFIFSLLFFPQLEFEGSSVRLEAGGVERTTLGASVPRVGDREFLPIISGTASQNLCRIPLIWCHRDYLLDSKSGKNVLNLGKLKMMPIHFCMSLMMEILSLLSVWYLIEFLSHHLSSINHVQRFPVCILDPFKCSWYLKILAK